MFIFHLKMVDHLNTYTLSLIKKYQVSIALQLMLLVQQSEIPLPSDVFCCFFLLEPWDVRELYIRKSADLPLQFLVGTFPRFVAFGFIFYQKPLYKSLHQSLIYSFITILPSESGVTLHYSTTLPQILLFNIYLSLRVITMMACRNQKSGR